MEVKRLTNKLRNLVYFDEISGEAFLDSYQIQKTKLQQAWVDQNGNEEWQDVPTVYELEPNND